MEFEAVSTVTVSCFIIQVRRQLDDINSLERTLLRADTTTNAKRLTNVGNLARGGNLNAQTTHTHHGAAALTLLSALRWLAFVRVYLSATATH